MKIHIMKTATAIVLAVAAMGTIAHAQPPARPEPCGDPCVSILTVGGFLGYMDGFPEFPGWPGDTLTKDLQTLQKITPPAGKPTPYGGLFGVQKWLGKRDPAASVLLIAGNNHPQLIARPYENRKDSPAAIRLAADWFWRPVADLNANAIAVGGEDLRRGLAQVQPGALVDWVRAAIRTRLPFVASNTIIRRSGSGLNLVRHKPSGIALEIAEDQSVGPLKELKLSHPCAMNIDATIFSFTGALVPRIDKAEREGGEQQSQATKQDVERELDGRCKTTLKLDSRLRPGRKYELASTSVVAQGARFTISTHDVLTPHDGPGSWKGLPVARFEQQQVPIAVMTFVSPTLNAEVPATHSTWKEADGCPVETCRIEVLDPNDAASWWLELAGSPMESAPPLLLVLSDLESDEEDELLDRFPQIRFLAISPESTRLGRAAPGSKETDVPRYSGDLSFGGVVDAEHPELTRLIVRPEWIGETVLIARAQLKAGGNGSPWKLDTPSVASHGVPGAELTWSFDPSRTHVTYAARFSDGTSTPSTAAFKRYRTLAPDGAFDHTCEKQDKLWTGKTDFTGLLLDEMRRSLGTDIAIVPAAWIDDEVTAWLAYLSAPGGTGRVDWLSGFILERLLFRAEPVVKISLPQTTLAAKLSAIVSQAAEAGKTVCTSGLNSAATCPLSKLDVKDLLVNIRRPRPGHFYSIALPASIARTHELEFDDEGLRDLLVPLDKRLSDSQCANDPQRKTESGDATTRPVAVRLEEELSGRIQRYLRLDPLSFEYSMTGVHEPDGQTGLLGKLPNDSSNAKNNREIIVEADVDFGLLDTRRYAIRVPAIVKLDRKDLEDQTSFDKNDFRVGVRGDVKKPLRRLATVFAGFFVEGDIADTKSKVKATRELPAFTDPTRPELQLTGVSVSGPSLTFRTRRSLFRFWSVGVELPKYERGKTTISEARVSLDYGESSNVPDKVLVGDQAFQFERYVREGSVGVLKAAYGADQLGITADTPFGFDYRKLTQGRLELDAKTETKFGDSKLGSSNRFRYYRHKGTDPVLATEWSWLGKVTFEWPIWKRWSVAPYVEVNLVRVASIKEKFRVVRAGVALKLTSFWKHGHGSLFE
jgi:hypothetical protein